jgi:hypothetical protein|tara:strand:+ start:671 stop:850 length:180 start_codon:yes stop_codon:yes gene_type:complete
VIKRIGKSFLAALTGGLLGMRSVDMMRDAFKAFSQKHHTYLSPVACHFFLAAPASIPAA